MNFIRTFINKIVIILFVFSLMAAVGSFNSSFAEAKNVDYKITSISLQNGKCTIYGYFYNSTGVTVTHVKIFGNIKTPQNTYYIDQDYDTTVGYIPAGATKSWSFTSEKNIYSYYNGTPKWDLIIRSTFN